MSANKQGQSDNTLLRALSQPEEKKFMADSTMVTLSDGKVLAAYGERLRHVYFPVGGYIGLTTSVDGNVLLGIGMVGDEGMLGTFPAFGIDVSPLNATVLLAGSALRMDVAVFRRHLVANPELLRMLKRYCCVMISQLAQASSCNRFHPVEQRLARRLLMMQDRAHSNVLRITQLSLADLLGVRRPAVSAAASELQNHNWIHYSRGDITILDRDALKSASCSCYERDNSIYQDIMNKPL